MKKLITILAIFIAVSVVNAQNFSETFQDSLPDTWTLIDNDGDSNNWYALVNAGTPVISGHGDNSLMTSASYAGVALTPDNWLITPQLAVAANGTITFWVCGQDSAWAAEHYGVYVSTTTPEVANFNLLFEETITATKVQGIWHEKDINLSSYAGQNVYIAFRHFNVTDMFRLNLDDITSVNVTIAGGSVGITETASNKVSIYPNPVKDVLNVNAAGFDKVEIVNFLGQVVYSNQVTASNFQINTADLTAGVYFVRLSGDNTVTKKFVKE